jgi:hypothetical protein
MKQRYKYICKNKKVQQKNIVKVNYNSYTSINTLLLLLLNLAL